VTATRTSSIELVDGLSVIRRRAEGPTVVFVHGAMDRATSFGRVMRRLPELDTIALDRRGYAGSLAAGVAPTIASHAQDVQRVIDWSGAAQAVVVGHSLGGRIALRLAEEGDPRLVAVAAFEAPAPDLDGTRDRVGAGAIEVGLRDGPEAAAEHFYRRMVGEDTWARLRDRDRAARRAEGPALLAELVDLRDGSDDLRPDAIGVPVAIGVGARSGEELRRGAHVLADHLPHASFTELAGAGHGAHLTHPDDFARYVAAVVPR
jgi:pimeloyl-ACP methyl ester carboxylesterase